MRDVTTVIRKVSELIPTNWGNRPFLLKRLDTILKQGVNTKAEKMGHVWADFLSAVSPIFTLADATWAQDIAGYIMSPDKDGEPIQTIDWTTVKAHDEYNKFLKACPECGKKGQQQVGGALFAGKKNYYALCLVCEKRTPQFDTPMDLIQFWNAEGKFASN